MAHTDKTKEISFGDDFGPAIVRINGVVIGISAAGKVDVRTATLPANDNGASQALTNDFKIGQLIADKGVFIGARNLKDHKHTNLGSFNLFAAPFDLGVDANGHGRKLVTTFNKAVQHVVTIRNLLGHDGGNFKNETALYRSILGGQYKGEWFLPTKDVLVENIYPNKDRGVLKDTFTPASGSGHADWYWSCTERRDVSSYVYDVAFADGDRGWGNKDNYSLSSRLVRAEPRLAP